MFPSPGEAVRGMKWHEQLCVRELRSKTPAFLVGVSLYAVGFFVNGLRWLPLASEKQDKMTSRDLIEGIGHAENEN
jgi:hypothetical protein